MNASFTIYRDNDKQYYYKLKSSAGEILLTGKAYPFRALSEKDIAAVRFNAQIPASFKNRMTKDDQYCFVIRNEEGRMLGKSEAFRSIEERDKASNIVQHLVRTAVIYDLT